MYKKIIVFVICFVLAFGEGYLFLSTKSASQTKAESAKAEQAVPAKASANASDSPAGTTAADKEGEIFAKRGCIACHSVSALSMKGGQVGPDLSTAFLNVESKHGMKVEDFLKKPNSAVMSGVIGGKPLTDDELKSVIAALKAASEKTKTQ